VMSGGTVEFLANSRAQDCLPELTAGRGLSLVLDEQAIAGYHLRVRERGVSFQAEYAITDWAAGRS